jgi:iron complex transport system ATP-binding protein
MLKVQSLTVGYANYEVLRDISINIDSGEILAVVGPNGVGKSTLIRAVSGTNLIRSGRVLVDGQDVTRLSVQQRARFMAVVPQARELPAAFTVYQTVLLGRTPYLSWLGKAGMHDHAVVSLSLEQTDLAGMAERRIGELSGGEQQRVLLARALAQDTPILLLDEPTTHLDLQHQSNLLNLVRLLVQEKNLCVLMVLHDLNLAGLYADRVALMANGGVFAMGEPAKVLTAQNLTTVYRVPVDVITHPEYGTPLVLPDGRISNNSIASGVAPQDTQATMRN